MPTNGRREYDDEDDYDRPRRRRRRDDDDDDYDDRPRRGRREKSSALLIVAIVVGSLLAVMGVVAGVLVATSDKGAKKPDDAPPVNPFDHGAVPVNRLPAPAFDHEGLPMGNDLDAILTRLNRRFQQNNHALYSMESLNLHTVKQQFTARSGEVFRTYRNHAGTHAIQPPINSVPYAAWQNAMNWATKDDVPELCRMLTAERVPARQQDLFRKLEAYKDPRCAEAVAPFLASQEHRGAAESILKELDSATERFVLPYLGAGQAKETRVAALQVVAAIGTKESAKAVEPLTRDADPLVHHHARIVFEKLSREYGVELDLLAVVKTLKDAIAAQNVSVIVDCERQLDKAYRADHPQRAEIFKGLVECCKIPDPKGYAKRTAFLGVTKWSSKDDVAALCELLIATGGESTLFLKLKEYKDPKCAETVAAFLAVRLKGDEAAAVLKAIGASAEKAVIPYTLRAAPNGAPIGFFTRGAAIDLLGEIGTKECIPLLRQLTADGQVGGNAKTALAKVLTRNK